MSMHLQSAGWARALLRSHAHCKHLHRKGTANAHALLVGRALTGVTAFPCSGCYLPKGDMVHSACTQSL